MKKVISIVVIVSLMTLSFSACVRKNDKDRSGDFYFKKSAKTEEGGSLSELETYEQSYTDKKTSASSNKKYSVSKKASASAVSASESAETAAKAASSVKTVSTDKNKSKIYSLSGSGSTARKIAEKIKMGGRTSFVADTGLTMYWTGDSVEFNIDGSGDVILDFKTPNETVCSKVKIYVDGQVFGGGLTTIKTDLSSVTVTGLGAGNHNFKIIRSDDGEGQSISLASITFNGTFSDRPPSKRYYIEVLGGASPTGSGALLGDNWFKEREKNWTSEDAAVARDRKNQDGTAAFPIIAADMIDADYSVVAHRGTGIVTTFHKTSDNIIDEDVGLLLNNYNLIHYSAARSDFDSSKRHPDAIIIDCSNTDLSNSCLAVTPNGDGVGIDYGQVKIRTINFFKTLREKHPNVKFVWCYNFDTYAENILSVAGGVRISLEGHIKNIVSQLGGEAAGYYIHKMEYNNIRRGFPSVEEHKKAGVELALMLRSIL